MAVLIEIDVRGGRVQYWVATSGTMAIIITLLAKYPVETAPWQISTAFIVLCACLQPLVRSPGEPPPPFVRLPLAPVVLPGGAFPPSL